MATQIAFWRIDRSQRFIRVNTAIVGENLFSQYPPVLPRSRLPRENYNGSFTNGDDLFRCSTDVCLDLVNANFIVSHYNRKTIASKLSSFCINLALIRSIFSEIEELNHIYFSQKVDKVGKICARNFKLLPRSYLHLQTSLMN